MNKIELAGCIILNKNKILLLDRKKTGWYELPGGKIEESELPEETAKREIKEELGCDVNIIKKFGEKEFEENGFVMNYHWFIAQIKENQEPKITEPEKYSHFKYLPIEELPNQNLSPNMLNLANEIKYLI